MQWAVDEGSTAVYKADPGVGKVRLAAATEPVRDFFHEHVYLSEKNWTFYGSWLILLVFVATLLANAYRRRFWCRYICPLGALLGVLAWRPLLRRDARRRRLQPVRPVREAVPWRGRRGARRTVEAVGMLRLHELHASSAAAAA